MKRPTGAGLFSERKLLLVGGPAALGSFDSYSSFLIVRRMHANKLIELAGFIAHHGPTLVQDEERIPEDAIHDYWIASKSRLDRWGRTLKVLSDQSKKKHLFHLVSQMTTFGVIEEILTGEVLTRVWTATLCAYDTHRRIELLGPIARSVLISHLEARHRVLTLLIRIDADEASKLNRLRRRCERFSDMLLGYQRGLVDVSQFAVDPNRANDFTKDLAYQNHRFVWPLIAASLEAAFPDTIEIPSHNADLNAKIAESILKCFQPGMFHSTNLFQSAWLLRLTSTANDAQGMIDQLIMTEQRHSSTPILET